MRTTNAHEDPVNLMQGITLFALSVFTLLPAYAAPLPEILPDSLLAYAEAGSSAKPLQTPLPPENSPSFWSRESMSGDWWGVRSGLMNNGIDLQILYRSDVIRNCMGGLCRGPGAISNVDVMLDLDGGAVLSWSGTRAFIHLLLNNGGSISSLVGDAQMVSNLESPRCAKVYQAYVEHAFGEHGVTLLAGLLDMNAEFYVTPASGIFLNGSHGVGKELSQAGLNGPSVFPNTGLAMRIRVPVSECVYSQAALFDGLPGTVEDPMAASFSWSLAEGCLAIAECGYAVEGSPGAPSTKLAVGGWWYPRSIMNAAANAGAYILAERQVTMGGDDGMEGLTLFLRAGVADAAVNRFGSHIGGGAVYRGLLPGRREDLLGFAIALASQTDECIRACELDGGSPCAGEMNVELSYRCMATPWLVVQPDFQYVRFPDADRSIPDATAFGVRMEVHF